MKIHSLIYVRHAADCPQKADRLSRKCRCPKWMSFSYQQKQYRESLHTKSWEQAVKNAQDREREILTGNANTGSQQQETGVTVEKAVLDWLRFRSANGLGNKKQDTVGNKLTEWCYANGIEFLRDITTQKAMQFRMSLPYRTADSSSLKIHWNVISSFFRWANGMKLIAENPVPSTRVNPTFKITFKKAEVVPPTKAEVDSILSKAEGDLRLLLSLMRWSGMALVDALKITSDRIKDGNLIQGNRSKTNERFSVRIPVWLAEELKKFDGFKLASRTYRVHMENLFKKANVDSTPHGLRHFRITELLSQGVRVDDVSDMVGTSPAEIRKTYKHWIAESQTRLDEIQRQAWLAAGLDENGNPR